MRRIAQEHHPRPRPDGQQVADYIEHERMSEVGERATQMLAQLGTRMLRHLLDLSVNQEEFEFIFHDSIPDSVCDVIEKACAIKEVERYASADEFNEALRAGVAQLQAPPPSPARRYRVRVFQQGRPRLPTTTSTGELLALLDEEDAARR